jgi:hypothetical protein
MSKLDDYAAVQWAGMKQGAGEVGRDIVADVGSTYQAFLMGDAGWRVPRAHGDVTQTVAQEAEMAEVEDAIAARDADTGIDLGNC